MSESTKILTRRGLLLGASFTILGLTTIRAFAKDTALPAGKKPVPPTDSIAKALGYVDDFKKADSTRFTQLKTPEAKSQRCFNCNFYKKENDGWGACQLLTAGVVNAEGWCASWVKKS